VVGASIDGGWALQSHVPAIEHVEFVELQAVATSRSASAHRSARGLGARRGYDNAAALAGDPGVKLVTVAVKVPAHASAVKAAIAAGKDVYCEWPLGVSTAEARSLRELAQTSGVHTVVGLQARLVPAVRRARALVADGVLGRILSVQAFSAGMGLGGPVLPADREWAADAANGLSVLTVRAAHTLDAVEFCAGPIAELSAQVSVATPAPILAGTGRTVVKTAPDQVLVAGRLLSGASLSAQFLLGVNPPHVPLLTIMGTRGSLSLIASTPDGQLQMSAITLLLGLLPSPLAPVPIEPVSPADSLPAAPAGVARMYEAIRDRRTDLPGFDHAVRLHELLDTLTEATSAGQRLRRPQAP
jgi:predicted dehydrogenase